MDGDRGRAPGVASMGRRVVEAQRRGAGHQPPPVALRQQLHVAHAQHATGAFRQGAALHRCGGHRGKQWQE
ncbi:hypothetical protein [Luteimonas yindakuii]|uniref:hypothetical protein n=1 Tax=Luteimonas yindakuii TaxID=2565782 RepID=UPI00106EF587|nr:hypothetical protein [Luteimonas yindakuii]